MIDINEVIKQLTPQDIIDIVSSIGGTDYIEREKEIIFKTICHNHHEEDGSHKLYYYKNSNLFVCYTCCGTFDIVNLIQKRYELLNREYNFYEDIVLPLAEKVNFKEKQKISSFYSPYDLDYSVYDKKQVQVNLPHLSPKILNVYSSHCVAEWLNDNISEEAMQYYHIKYSIEENKVIIPHYDKDGYLIGIRGRALDPDEAAAQGKYRPIVFNEKVLSHPLGYNLYGLNFVYDNIKKYQMAIVAEGEKSVLQYMSYFGHERNICVATCGNKISSYQVDLLCSAGASKILIAFDKEGESWKDKEKYFQSLKDICLKYKYKAQFGFIWDNENLLNLKDSPFDKGKDTFLKLYNNAIWL